ncbi:MAG TPA: histidine kinase [Casimicrobiaceae bacterium]|nr:histidine kinase [Casimicrobiaceae bacterium]
MFVAEPHGTPACEGFRHPLEIFPVFRRLRPSFARDVAYTIVWNSLVALLFTALSLVIDPSASIVDSLRITFVFAQCIGFVIFAAFVVTEKLFGAAIRRAHFWVRSAYYGLVASVAIFPGYLIAFRLLDWKNGSDWLFSPRAVVSIVAVSLAITAVLLMIFVPRERAARAEAAVAREQARAAAAQNEATTARMKLLEAQVEPHFLYNTLAHVISLIDAEPRTAKGMIEQLIALLRASAAAASAKTTLGVQLDLLGAYLDIVAMRMGQRLRWRIDVPAPLRDLAVPPMLLQPIVENAVKHGIEPSLAGGKIVVSGSREGSMLVLRVADTGGGFRTTSAVGSGGIGLANLRARLATAYGEDASLILEDLSPHGTRATLRVPIPIARREPRASSMPSTVDASA